MKERWKIEWEISGQWREIHYAAHETMQMMRLSLKTLKLSYRIYDNGHLYESYTAPEQKKGRKDK